MCGQGGFNEGEIMVTIYSIWDDAREPSALAVEYYLLQIWCNFPTCMTRSKFYIILLYLSYMYFKVCNS